LRVGVTGASGFIGRHVVAELKKKLITPVVILRPYSVVPPYLSDLELVRIDIGAPPENSFDLMGRPDLLIHLAWDGLPNYKSSRHLEFELHAQYHFLNRLIDDGLENLFVAGTCFEYGMASGQLHESIETRPSNAYGEAKDILRRRLQELQMKKKFLFTWVRLFYLYGLGQVESSLVSQLEHAIKSGNGVFNMSGGEQLRDYLPVRVAAERIVSLVELKTLVGVVNICSGEPISVREFVETYLEKNNSSLKLNFGAFPYSEYEPMEFWGDGRYYRELMDKNEPA